MLELGTIVNERYRVLRRIGEGGMGAVYEAEHTAVGRKVAIKVLHAQYAHNAEVVVRFGREARAAAAIGHENIIDVLDVGTHDGAPYIVMEFLKGESLGARLASGPLPVGAAAYVMRQVLLALHAAHAVGVIHRDLKPDNVYLIARSGAQDFVKLLDFGVSKFTNAQTAGGGLGQELTAAGTLVGTPYYMAPEQALGQRDIDPRADVYSAGVMLYQMVTGKLPFAGGTQSEVLLTVIHGLHAVPPPHTLVPDVPAAFSAAVMRAMAHDRAARFADATEFAHVLSAYVTAPPAAGDTRRHAAVGSTPDAARATTGPLAVAGAANGPHKTSTPLGWEGRPVPTAPVAPANHATAPAPYSPLMAVGIVGGLAVVGVVAALLIPKPHRQPAAASTVERAPSNTPQVHTPQVSSPAPAPAPAPAMVTVELTGLPPDAVITVDGETATDAHLSFPQNSSHRIRVAAPGMVPYDATVMAQQDRTIAITLVPEVPEATAPPPP